MATDQMLSGHVELIQAAVLCREGYCLVTGDVGAVEAAVENGFRFDTAFAISSLSFLVTHPSVFLPLWPPPALTAGSLALLRLIDDPRPWSPVTWQQKPLILNYKYGWLRVWESICLPMW